MSPAETWPKALFWGEKGAGSQAAQSGNQAESTDSEELPRFHNQIHREKRNLIQFSYLLSILFVAVSNNDSSDTDCLMNTPKTWQVWVSEHWCDEDSHSGCCNLNDTDTIKMPGSRVQKQMEKVWETQALKLATC